MLDLLVGFSILCQGGDVLPKTTVRNPVARWTQVQNMTYGDDFVLTLQAEHISGISQVHFSIDGGKPLVVSSKATDPNTGYREYLFPVGPLADGRHEVTATIIANSGDSLFLGGVDPMTLTDLNHRNDDTNSFYFYTGEEPVITVGPNGQYPSIDAAYASQNLRGKRLLLEPGDYSGPIRDYGGVWSDRPVVIQGVEGTNFYGVFERQKASSLVMMDMKVFVPESTTNGQKMFKGRPGNTNALALINLEFVPDSDDPNAWQDLKWGQTTDFNWYGGIYSIGNHYNGINFGPAQVTISKHDLFTDLTADALGKNPGGIFDCRIDRSSAECATHGLHTDLMQYFNPQKYEEYGACVNRMFVDIEFLNFYAQPGHFEGDKRRYEDGTKYQTYYKDWYFARWTADCHSTSQSLNIVANGWENITFEDMNFRNASIDLLSSNDYVGLICKNVITTKWRGRQEPAEMFSDNGNSFTNWHVEQTGNGSEALTSTGPVDWANPEPPIVSYGCPGVPYSDPDLIDLSNTVFGGGCYTGEDLAGLLQDFGSSNSEWDLDGDGIVNGKDIALCLANFCS